MKNLVIQICLPMIYLANFAYSQYDIEYERLHIGKFITYSHQIQGDVYAINRYTLLIRNFYYDGTGKDTYFWSGSTSKPSNIGFIVPDDEGKTNRLPRYSDKDFTLTLPDNKKITEVRWLSVYDIRSNRNFADIYIPEGLNIPGPQEIAEFSRKGSGVKSGSVSIIDSRTIDVKDFHFKSTGANVFFWVGNGSFPRPSGMKIPDENGYLNPLKTYDGRYIRLELPGHLSVFKINWLAVWDVDQQLELGSVNIPDGLHVPPSLVKVINRGSMKFCEQLHRNLQFQWKIESPSINVALVARMEHDDYLAFGISGSEERSQMVNGDASISYFIGKTGTTKDYNITALAPCSNILGRYKGVCPDFPHLGQANYQYLGSSLVDGIGTFNYTRRLSNIADHGDKSFHHDREQFFIWAIGKINPMQEPGFHHTYPKANVKLNLGTPTVDSTCFDFTTKSRENPKPWGPFRISEKNLDTFNVRLGPSGALRGYYGQTGLSPASNVFYINGLLAPELYVKRGQKYKFIVEAGNNPHDALYYHPFYLTENKYGAFSSMTPEEITQEKINMVIGIKFSRRGRPQPTTAGRLCLWKLDKYSPREADNFPSFARYRGEMTLHCDKGKPAILTWTPNSTTPDTVYYQSSSHRSMGWKINVVDEITVFAGTPSVTASAFTITCAIALFYAFK